VTGFMFFNRPYLDIVINLPTDVMAKEKRCYFLSSAKKSQIFTGKLFFTSNSL
jgi:hypothetical protein